MIYRNIFIHPLIEQDCVLVKLPWIELNYNTIQEESVDVIRDFIFYFDKGRQ
jgi:hypothetical protein